MRKKNKDIKYIDIVCEECSLEDCKKKTDEVCKLTDEIISKNVCNPATNDGNDDNEK